MLGVINMKNNLFPSRVVEEFSSSLDDYIKSWALDAKKKLGGIVETATDKLEPSNQSMTTFKE